MKQLLVPALIAPLMFAVAVSPAEAADKIVVKAGTVAPAGTPWSELLKKIKRRMSKESGKQIKLKSYFGGRLGGEKEMVRETREGRLQMFGGSLSALATVVPELYALEAPFLFSSSEEADFVHDKHARPVVEQLLADRGFVLYQFAENGWHGLALKGPCMKSLSDLKGKKLRSQEAKIHLDTFRALGANPVAMAVPEVLPALKTGTVDGFSNTPLFSFATSWYQGVTSYTETNHIYQPGALVYSKKWFDKQTKETQAILLAGFEKETKYGRKAVRAIRPGLIDNFRKEKIEVCKVTPALRAEMAKATSKVFNKYKKKAGKKGKKPFDAIVAGKKAFKAK